jgi:hypothetical protein
MFETNQKSQFAGARISMAVLILVTQCVVAQNPDMQQKAAQIKESMAANKQALSHYTWQEQQTVSVKGEVKKQQLFQVQDGPNGKPQKTLVGPPPEQQEPSGGRLKRHVVEKKKEEFKDYAQQIAELAQSYAQPEPGKLQQAFAQGNAMFGSAGAPGEIKLVIHNYVKPNDTVTMTFNTAEKAIQGLQIASYLDDPKDAVNITAQFARLPDGTNHVSNMLVNGVKKELTVNIENSNYQKLPGGMQG